MSISQAPIADKLLDDSGKLRPTWVIYFGELNRGDVGTTWNPTIVNLTSTGTPTITGVYYQNDGFTDFAVKIVPATDTSSVAGSTTIAVPFNVTADTIVNVVSSGGYDFGRIISSSKTIFLPTWSLITVPLTITGRVKN